MANKLIRFYEFAMSEGGPTARMRLAMMTSIPSKKAATVADSPEVIEKFQKAIKQITGKNPPII